MSNERIGMFNNVLIIDDQESIIDDFKKILTNSNANISKSDDLMSQLLSNGKESVRKKTEDRSAKVFSVSQGQDGVVAVKDAINKGDPFQVVFVDMRMPPGWDGLKTIEEIWKIDKNIQTVICTAYSDYSWDEIVNRLGNSDRLLILKKPFEIIEVLQLVAALCNKWFLTYEMNQMVEQQTFKIKKQEEAIIHASRIAAMGEMASGIAHEINNPLAIINGYMLIMEKIVKEKDFSKINDLNDHIKFVKETVIRITKIVDNMSKLSRDCSEDPEESILVKTFIHDTLSICVEKIKNNDVDLRVEGCEDNLNVLSRGTQLHQAFLNLVLNAYDAAIECHEDKWMQVKYYQDKKHVYITLTNCGKKIDSEKASKIFEPFYTTKKVGKGTGLGLSISRRIIESHGGELYLNEESECTEFVVKLPIV